MLAFHYAFFLLFLHSLSLYWHFVMPVSASVFTVCLCIGSFFITCFPLVSSPFVSVGTLLCFFPLVPSQFVSVLSFYYVFFSLVSSQFVSVLALHYAFFACFSIVCHYIGTSSCYMSAERDPRLQQATAG